MAKKNEKIDLSWLKFFHKDWNSSIRVAKLSVSARYCYFELLLYCFEHGGFKDSMDDIRYICRLKTRKNLDMWWREIQEQGFFMYEDGLWRNAKMDSIRGDAEERWGQKVLDAQIVPTAPAPAIGIRPLPTLGMVSNGTQTDLGRTSDGSQTDFNRISTKPNDPGINAQPLQITKDLSKKDQVSKGIKESANPEGPTAPATSRVDTDPSPNEAKGSPAGLCATPDTSDFLNWTCTHNSGTDQEFQVTYDIPLPETELIKETNYQTWKEMRLATLAPTASEVEIRFSNPWMNPQWYGNAQNVGVACMDQHNLLCRMPGRKGDTVLNTQGYEHCMKGFIQQIDTPTSYHAIPIKIQLALHYLSYNLKPFKLSFPDYLGEFKLNHLQEHCAKGLDRNAWGKGKPGIPVMLLMEIEPRKWVWHPALVWSIRYEGANHIPVYALLNKDGKPESDHYTEVGGWAWDEGYQWPWKDKKPS